MQNKISKSKSIPASQVFEALGQALYICNVIETRLRWMHKNKNHIWSEKTPEKLLKSIKKTMEEPHRDNRPLGPVGDELLDDLYTSPTNKDLTAIEEKGLFALKIDFKINWKGRARQAKSKFKKFKDARNYLVHHFAEDYNLTSPESCQKAYAFLEEKSKIFADTFNFFNVDYGMMKTGIQEMQATLTTLSKAKKS